MSSNAMLVEVVVLDRGTAIVADASSGDSVIQVEDTTQFDSGEDDNEGEAIGTIDICGIRYDYLAVDEDTDEITLATPLTADVDESDPVIVVVGGQAAKDYLAVVDIAGGDTVRVPLSYSWRSQLPEGLYDPPVPVTISKDLQRLTDAPGRTVLSRVAFRNTDTYTFDGVASSIRLPLTKLPIDGSEQVFWKAASSVVGGLGLPRSSWYYEEDQVVIDDGDLLAEFSDSDLFWIDYAWDEALDAIRIPPEVPPLTVGTAGDLAGLANNFVNNTESLNIIVAQPGETVTANKSGTLTSVTIGRGSSLATSGQFYVVTGSISGSSFTVTDVSGLLARSGSDPATMACSVDINAGDYLAIYLPNVSPTPLGYKTFVTGAKFGYANHVTSVPAPADVITFDPDASDGNLLTFQAMGA